jgi:hypothetical protein
MLNLLLTEELYQLGEDVSSLIRAEKLGVLSIHVIEAASFKNFLV